ncbi:MAG: hypothetical protein KC466_16590 [Myxococcales bacterium]|nr:hypothetical protein [Myxococcales bacterium]
MRRSPARWTLLFGCATAVALTSSCASKIPQVSDLEGDPAELAEKGRAWVARSVAVHGGYEAWSALGDVAFTMRDTWEGLGDFLGPDFPVDDPQVRYHYHYGLNKGRMSFAGARGAAWGHDSREGWCEQGGERTYDRVDDATFIVPTLAYFFALPFKFADPGVRPYYAGRRDYHGAGAESVLITFGEGVGVVQDRYLAFFDPATARLVGTTYTVKEKPFTPEADAQYLAWREVGGLVMPGRIEIDLIRPLTGDLQTMEFFDIDLDAEFDRRLYEKPDAR